MKEIVLMSLAVSFLLIGCENRSNEEGVASETTNSVVLGESVDEQIENEELESVSEKELQQSPIITDFEAFDEVSQQTYVDPSEYDGYVLTDNNATRVLIFAKENTQVYKTIFIKETNQLKIIDLVNHTLVMNEHVQLNNE